MWFCKVCALWRVSNVLLSKWFKKIKSWEEPVRGKIHIWILITTMWELKQMGLWHYKFTSIYILKKSAPKANDMQHLWDKLYSKYIEGHTFLQVCLLKHVVLPEYMICAAKSGFSSYGQVSMNQRVLSTKDMYWNLKRISTVENNWIVLTISCCTKVHNTHIKIK